MHNCIHLGEEKADLCKYDWRIQHIM